MSLGPLGRGVAVVGRPGSADRNAIGRPGRIGRRARGSARAGPLLRAVGLCLAGVAGEGLSRAEAVQAIATRSPGSLSPAVVP